MRSLCIQVVVIPPTDPILRFWYVITQPSLSEKQALHSEAKRKNQPSPLSRFNGPLWDLLPGRLALAGHSPLWLQVSSLWLSTPPCQWGTHTVFPYYQHKKSKLLQNIKYIRLWIRQRPWNTSSPITLLILWPAHCSSLVYLPTIPSCISNLFLNQFLEVCISFFKLTQLFFVVLFNSAVRPSQINRAWTMCTVGSPRRNSATGCSFKWWIKGFPKVTLEAGDFWSVPVLGVWVWYVIARSIAQLWESSRAKLTVTERTACKAIAVSEAASCCSISKSTGCPAGHILILEEWATHLQSHLVGDSALKPAVGTNVFVRYTPLWINIK